MKPKILIPITIFAVLIVLLFLGNTITGLVISQSCCYPPNCNEEQMCNNAGPREENPIKISKNNTLILAGAITFLALTIILLNNTKKH